jgi:hypothetical protein
MDISKHLPSLPRYLGTALGKIAGVIRVEPFRSALSKTLKAVKPSSGPSGRGPTVKGYNPVP